MEFYWFLVLVVRYGYLLGFFAVFLDIMGRRAFLMPLAGSVRMPYGQFVLFDGLGAFFWSSLFIATGYLLGNQAGVFGERLHRGVIFLGSPAGHCLCRLPGDEILEASLPPGRPVHATFAWGAVAPRVCPVCRRGPDEARVRMNAPLILTTIPGAQLEALETQAERLAFWINTYNALVIEGIAALEIRQSVWEVPHFFARISCCIGDLTFNADEIEHGVLRGNRPNPLSGADTFRAGDPRTKYVISPMDPRVHFAISCGARSCPPIRTYDPRELDQQLDDATRAFVNQEIRLEGGRLTGSELLKWFREDFEDFPGGLAGFLARYLEDGPVRRAVVERGVTGMAWRPYDWSLQLPAPPADGGVK